MKNWILNVFIVVSMVIGFTSCQKEPLEPINPQTTIDNQPNTNPIGYVWELYSGRVFVRNLDNNSTFYYDHFGSTKNSSNLDIFISSGLPFDMISKGMTTWKFTSSNQFILDGSSTYNYNTNTNGIFNVYGMENGSARNIEVLSSTDNVMNVKVYESNGNDGVNNFTFYTVLTFVKVGYTGSVTEYTVPSGYSYSGVVGNPSTATTLVGTKWVVTKYVQNFVTQLPNDTLEFISTTQYTVNGSVPRNYSLSGIVGNNMKSLSLYSFTTLGGDWSGQVQGTFINDWVINNALFTDMFTSVPDARMWVVRIQ